jgi:hypothetical protein
MPCAYSPENQRMRSEFVSVREIGADTNGVRVFGSFGDWKAVSAASAELGKVASLQVSKPSPVLPSKETRRRLVRWGSDAQWVESPVCTKLNQPGCLKASV